MNCDADHEASEYKWPDNRSSLTVTPLPETPCQLIIQGKSITGHIKRRIREESTIPALKEYLKKKFEWDQPTLDAIDWPLYQEIITKYKSQRTTLVKHLHDISPTGHIANRNNKHLPHNCPACQAPHEDNKHVLTCNHRSRLEWRAETLQKIRLYEQNNSDPHLLDILTDGLMRFHRSLDLMNPNSYPVRYHDLIIQQNAIGWGQLYRGRWTQTWTTLQNQYHRNHWNSTSSNCPRHWLLGLGRLLLDQWLKIWKIRNEQRHGQETEHHSRIRQQVLHSELTELYALRTKVCPTDRAIFYSNVQHHLSQHSSLDLIENWINSHKEAIRASVEQAKKMGIMSNRALDDYPAFNPIDHVMET